MYQMHSAAMAALVRLDTNVLIAINLAKEKILIYHKPMKLLSWNNN